MHTASSRDPQPSVKMPVIESQAQTTYYGAGAAQMWGGAGAETQRESCNNVTEHPPWECAQEQGHGVSESGMSASVEATGDQLQCPKCDTPLCSTEKLAFFHRRNKDGGVEVHLMLKPEEEATSSPTFRRSADTKKGATASWQCERCETDLGNTRNVGVGKAAMTAFKSSDVKLFGTCFSGRKSKWPSVYNKWPYNVIEVRNSDSFFGPDASPGL